MSDEIAKVYDPKKVEEKWLEFWFKEQLFHAEPGSDRTKNFSMVIPPPNVTGSLHMGHALNNTLQDILVRYKRMNGLNVLWVPGTDHAGIATQNVVERELKKEGKRRQDLGREEFIKKVWEWKEKHGNHIIHQLKKLGSSCDWDRERFTMDEGLSRAVREAFVRLYEKQLIYRDLYLINWCPRCLTALSDIEVEHEETNGFLWYIRYPAAGGPPAAPLQVIVATTRPETLLGDTAVAVHPEDERYKHLIGKKLALPLTDREIPIISDHRVDREFGTGAVKVTPAHDFNDFIFGNDHKMERINLFTPGAKMNENAGRFQGLDRFEARKQIVTELEEKGLLVKTEPHKLSVGHCYRCKTVVEPYLSLQWFVKTKPLAARALQAVRDQKTKFHPENWTKVYEQWMETIKDWCISRQIWWGHRIPAWYCENSCPPMVARETPTQCSRCGSKNLKQDEDVLDTWFSSGLWPFSTMGWPDQTPELKAYYPTSVLVTGFDIIFFWVARMMMMGLEFMNDVPFKDVYIHALVRDVQGQKMSKSKGNVIDPLSVMDRYGTDAFRFTLAALAAQGRDIKLSDEIIEGYRNFCNKIWNATRFALMNLGDHQPYQGAADDGDSPYDSWIRHKLKQTIQKVKASLEEYKFDVAAKSIYQFFWHDLCDWYIEFCKINLNKQVLYEVLMNSFCLLHPFMPFITEELWHKVGRGRHKIKSITQVNFPDPDFILSPLQEQTAHYDIEIVEMLTFLIEGIRSIRGENHILPSLPIKVTIFSKRGEDRIHLIDRKETIQRLGRCADVQIVEQPVLQKQMAHVVISEGLEVFVSLEDLVDFELEKKRLEKEITKLKEDTGRRQKRLSDSNFISRADPAIVAEERKTVEDNQVKIARLEETLRNIL